MQQELFGRTLIAELSQIGQRLENIAEHPDMTESLRSDVNDAIDHVTFTKKYAVEELEMFMKENKE